MKNIQYIVLLFFAIQVYSQTTYQQIALKTLNESSSAIESKLPNLLGVSPSNSFKEISNTLLSDELGYEHSRVQQYYNGIKIEDAILILHKKDNTIVSTNGEILKNFNGSIIPVITESSALNYAISNINAQTYIWQNSLDNQLIIGSNTLPKGDIVICKNYSSTDVNNYRLAYKFDIYATTPLGRYYVYVDAQNGNILYKRSLINDCHHNKNTSLFSKKKSIFVAGNAQTRYSGSRSIETSFTGNGYNLYDSTRGLGIETYNLNRTNNYSAAINFIDNNNNWTATEWNNSFKDNAALDAHFGAEKTYDYFLQKHNRASFDNSNAKIKSYLHYSTNYFNAFWNGSVMTYGDGDSRNNYNPLTSIDVAAHEIGHAVCSYSANLVYSNESGALNESFSDIWGACVEYFTDPNKQTWLLGEDFQYPIRSMSNPNAYNQPNTYEGTNWYIGTGDFGGVHTNSGVQNYWFYLLSVGGSGTNDKGIAYSVAGIGIEKAAKIAYRTETVYLTSNSVYNDSRNFSIQAAIDLFGADSPEANSTERAWCAVGIGTCLPCQGNIAITTPITTSKNYQVSNEITSNSTINSNLSVMFRASRIKLLPGFKVAGTTGSNFRAYYNPCMTFDASVGKANFEYVHDIQIEKTEQIESIYKILPNPNDGTFTIQFENINDNLVEIYNLTEQKIFEKKYENINSAAVNLEIGTKGIYLVKCTSNGVSRTLKMIIK